MMKPAEVMRHHQNFSKLNLPNINYEEQIRNRILKITTNASTTTPILEEIRDLTFYIPSNELENVTKAVAHQIINVIINLASAPNTEEIISFRINLLDLLSIINYHFFPVGLNSEFLDIFFKIISDGTINEMGAAAKLLRQSFDILGPQNNAFIVTIGKNTLIAAEKRLKNLVENSDTADVSSFFPFITLLTVLSYCAKTSETLREPISKIFISTESYVKDVKFDKKRFRTDLPNFAIKARIIHSLMLLIDSPARDKQLSFLIDSYISLFKNCPISYSTIKDEVSSSFFCYLAQTIDDERTERIIKAVPSLLNIPLGKPEYFYSSISVALKIFEVLLSYPKLPWILIDHMITYTTNVIHYSDVVLISRCQRFSVLTSILLKRLNLLDMRSSRPLFLILFNIHHAFQLISESVVDMKINPKTESTELKHSQQHMLDITILFESFSRILEIFAKTARLINLYQLRLEKIAQDGGNPTKNPTSSQQQNLLMQINSQKIQQMQQQNQTNKLLQQQQQQLSQQLQLQRIQKQIQQQQQQQNHQQNANSQTQNAAQVLGLSLRHSTSITTEGIATLISSISASMNANASLNSANKNPNLNLNLVNPSSPASGINLSSLVSRSQTPTTPAAKVAASVIQNASLNSSASSSFSSASTPTTQQSQSSLSNSSQNANSAPNASSSTSIPKIKIAYPFDSAGANLLVNTYVSILHIFLKIRTILHQCNLKFSLKPTSSDYISNLKSCANHKKYVQYYEKERYFNQMSFKIIAESLFQTKPPILINIWERFIEKLIGKDGMNLNDIYFIRFFLSYPNIFGPFYRAFVKEVIKGLQNPSNLNLLFHVGNEIIERLIEFGHFQSEIKEPFTKQILKDTKYLFKYFETNFAFLQDAREPLIFLVNISKFITILILNPISKKQNSFNSLSSSNNNSSSTNNASYLDHSPVSDSFLREIITTKFVKTICSSIADYPSDFSGLLNFLNFCNNKLPHTVENETVMTVLINLASVKPNYSLSLISSILKRKPELIQDGISSEISTASYSRSSNLAEVALNAMIYAPETNSMNVLLKFLKRAPLEFVRPDSILTNKCIFSFSKNDSSANFDAEMFLSSFSPNIESTDLNLWESLLLFIFDLLLPNKPKLNIDENNSEDQNEKEKSDISDRNEFLNSNYVQTGYSNTYIIASKLFIFIASFAKKREKEVRYFFNLFFNEHEKILKYSINYKTSIRIKSLAFSSVIQCIDDIGDNILKIEKLIGNSKDNFTYFFSSCIEIIETVPLSNPLMKEALIADFIYKRFSMDIINTQLMIQIVIHSIPPSPLLSERDNLVYRNSIDFYFHELSLMPELFKSIVDKTKSLIKDSTIRSAGMNNPNDIFDPTIFLNYVKSASSSSVDSSINWTRIISCEFLTVTNIDEMIVEQFISNLFQFSEYRFKLLIFEIISPLLRCFPSLTIKFIDQIDSLLDYYIKDSKTVDKTLENQISAIITPILQCDEIKDISKYNSLIDTVVRSIDKTIPDFLALLKNKVSNDKFSDVMQTIKNKLNNDCLYELKKTSNSSKQPLANWCNISKYWRTIFYIYKNDFVHVLISQFAQFSDGMIDSLSVDRMKEFYHSIASIISDKIIVKHILKEESRNSNSYPDSSNPNQSQNEPSQNQSMRSIIDQIILCFLKIFERYNATISSDMYIPLIHFIEATGSNNANACLSKYLQDQRTTLAIRNILQLPEGRNLKLDFFDSRKDFILSKLNLADPKNFQHLQYMNQQQASPQQQQQQNDYLLYSIPSEPTISFALLCPGLPNFETEYLIPYLRIFRRFLLLKKETYSFTLLLELIMQYFESFQPYLLSIILDGILTQDPTVVSYMKRIIKLYINYPKISKETLASVEFVYKEEEEEEYKLELLGQDIRGVNDPIIIQDNEDNLYFSYYVKSMLLPFSKLNENCAQFFYEHYGVTISKRIIIAYLFIDIPDFIFTSTESYEMLQSSDSDVEKDEIFYIWSKSKQNGHFNEMIINFLDSISVHVSAYAKNVFDTLKIPIKKEDDNGKNDVDVDLIFNKIEATILKFLRHPIVLMSIWTLVMNNIEALPNFAEKHWSLLLTQVANIRFYAKKTQIASTTPIAEALTKIFTYSPPPQNVSHQVIFYFSLFLTSTLKSIIENYSTVPIKKSIPFLKCCKKLTQMYGNQLNVATDFFQIFLEYFTKNVQQKQLQLQQQQTFQHVSQSSSNTYQFIFDTILQYVPKIITPVLKFEPPFKLEPYVDALLPVSLLTSSISWPYALNALHQIAQANLYTDKIKKLIDNIEKEETGAFIFPLLWMNSAFSEYRMSTLLPWVFKWCNNNNNNSSSVSSNSSNSNSSSNQQQQQQQQSSGPSNNQQQQQTAHSNSSSHQNASSSSNSTQPSSTNQFQETSIHQFMLRADFKTMIDYPVGQTLQKLFNEMNQENPKRYASFFLPSILVTPPKSRYVSNCIESFLQDPKMCMLIASPNVAPAEQDIQFKFGILAKLAYIMTHPDSIFLDELANIGSSSGESADSEFDISSTFSFEMKALVVEAQKIDALEIPLAIIMFKYLPKFITRRLSLHKFLQITHLFRPEYKKMSLNNFFLTNSNSILTQIKQNMENTEENSSSLTELRSFEKSTMKWNSTLLSSLDEIFPSLSEYQVFDLTDSKHILLGRKISSVATFLHHGMLTHALFSAKNSLNEIHNEDLIKIRMKDSAFTNFSEELIKEEASSLPSDLSQPLKSTSNDAISNAIRDLPAKAKIPFSNKLANLFFASKLKKINKLLKIELDLHKKKQHSQQQLLLKPLKNGIFSKFSCYKQIKNLNYEICGGYFNHDCFDSFPHFFTPSAQKAYEELRKSTYSLLKIENPDSFAESIHHKNLLKSYRQNFIEERLPLPSADSLVSACDSSGNYKKLLICFASNVENEEWSQIFDEILRKALTTHSVKKENPSHSHFYADNCCDDLILSFLYRNLTLKPSFAESFNFEDSFSSSGIPFRWSHLFTEIRNDSVQTKIEKFIPISFWPIRRNLLPFIRCENVNRILEASIDALSDSKEREKNKDYQETDYDSSIDEFDTQIFQNLNVQTSSLSQNKTPMPFFPSSNAINIDLHVSESSSTGRRNQTTSSLSFDDLVLCVDSVCPIACKISDSSLKLVFRSTRGDRINYTVSTEPAMECHLSLLSALISRIFDGFVDTRRRGMKTAGYQSFFIKTTNGSTGFVTRMDAIPLPRFPSISSKRWSSFQHKKIIEKLPSTQFICTAEYINWSSIFSYRHAALCSIQLLLDSMMIDIGDMAIDHKYALPSVSKMLKNTEKVETKLRLNGILRYYIDDIMRFGPFKAGLISSFLCMGYKREKIRIYLMNIMLRDGSDNDDCRFTCNEAEDRINKISEMSIAESNLDEVNDQILHLIKCSTEYTDQYDEVFNSEYQIYNNSIFM